MARVTKKDLEQKIKELEDMANSLSRQVVELYKEKEDILSNKNMIDKDEFDGVVKQLEQIEYNYNSLKSQNEYLIQKNNRLIEKCSKLEEENRQLLTRITNKKHNERGAGRKSRLTEETLQKINYLREQGFSYGEIAKEVELSKAYVYKLINKQ